MTMLDYQERFGTDQAVTDSVVNSTNTYDTRNTIDRLDQTMTVEFLVTEAFAGGTSLALEVMEDAASDRGTETVAVSKTILLADLGIGEVFHIQMPRKTKRYIGTQFTPSGTFSAGKISSYLIDKPQTNGYDVNVEFKAIDNSGR